jgi:hypothetical protein
MYTIISLYLSAVVVAILGLNLYKTNKKNPDKIMGYFILLCLGLIGITTPLATGMLLPSFYNYFLMISNISLAYVANSYFNMIYSIQIIQNIKLLKVLPYILFGIEDVMLFFFPAKPIYFHKIGIVNYGYPLGLSYYHNIVAAILFIYIAVSYLRIAHKFRSNFQIKTKTTYIGVAILVVLFFIIPSEFFENVYLSILASLSYLVGFSIGTIGLYVRKQEENNV